MIPPERLLSASLQCHSQGQVIARILSAALNAVDPYQAVRRHVRRQGNHLLVGERVFHLSPSGRVFLIGAGKASRSMARALVDILGDDLTAGAVITKEGQGETHIGAVSVLHGGHPLPDEQSLASTRQVLSRVTDPQPDDLVLCVISGGGSALLTDPTEGIGLSDLQHLTQALLACGASIQEINVLRKHLDRVKGGQLLRRLAPARVISLILSDVVGNPLDVIASGPTAPDPSTYQQGLEILSRYGLPAQIPASILHVLERGARGELPETPKPDDPIFQQVTHQIVGDNFQAAQAAVDTAREAGFHAGLLTTYLQGEAREAGQFLAAVLRQMAFSGDPLPRPACLVVGGETTVTLDDTEAPKDFGGLRAKGGRNQELALAAVKGLAGLQDVFLVTLATDGEDGPTDAAGAVVTGETLNRAQRQGMDVAEHLQHHASYTFFAALDDLLKPGYSGTNVNDLTLLLAP